MNSIHLTALIIIAIAIVLAVVIAVLVDKSNKEPLSSKRKEESRGEMGEHDMAMLLRALPRELYTVFNDLMVLYNGHTVQIDHVVVSQFGIFVIETKNIQGWIYGGKDSENWLQTLNGHEYQIYNPILQNGGHVNALSNMLSLDAFNFVSIIAFSRNAGFKYPIADNVMYIDQVKAAIQTYTQPLLSEEKVSQICQWLFHLNIESEEVRQKHVNDVTEVVAQKRVAVADGICPRCGGELVLRNGRYGDFYGCRNYPRCNYTKPLK